MLRCGVELLFGTILRHFVRVLIPSHFLQGMNDYLVPILRQLGESGTPNEWLESDSFWCFKGLMDTYSRNFSKSGQGMRMQLW